MTEEQKQALINRCKNRIAFYKAAGNTGTFDADTLQLTEIALAALTAQPVKLLDCDFGAVYHMSGGNKDYCNGFVDGTQNAIKAIRAAGYPVESE